MTDFRYALRTLQRAPGFAAAAILCMGLGIGANTAIFTVVNAVVMRPLNYAAPERLLRVYTEFPGFPGGGLKKFWMSPPELLDLRQLTKQWEALEGYAITGVNFSGGQEPLRVTAAQLTGGMLPMLGVAPQVGRHLTSEDDRFGAPLSIMISDGLYQRAFGGAPAIVGREVKVNGLTATVAGVMPAGFAFPPGETDPPEIWVPMQLNLSSPGSRSSHFLSVVGRLKPGVSPKQAQDELQQIVNEQGPRATPNTHLFHPVNHTLVALPWQDEIVGGVRTAMWVMLGAVAFVLLIACVNVGNLLLARAESRHHEIAVRKAVGASNWTLIRQCAVEGLVLAAAGALVGLLLAKGGLTLILNLNQGSIPRAAEISMDWPVLAFTLLATLITGLLFGLAPLAQISAASHESLKTAAGRSSGTARSNIIRRVLVASELALALVLLVGASLMVKTFWKLQQVNIGLEPDRVVTMRLALPQSQYPQSGQALSFFASLRDRVAAMPGVEGATVFSGMPPVRPLNANDTEIEGFVPRPGGPIQNCDYWQTVSPGFFETLKVRLIEGRFLDERDGAEAPRVAVVNQTFARTFYGHSSAVGRRIRPGSEGAWATIVGVVGDIKNAGPDKPTGTELFLPRMQSGGFGARGAFLAFRTAGDPRLLLPAVRAEIARMDPALPIAQVRLLDEIVGAASARPRFLTALLGLFAVVALMLAAVGIYGVISYTVAQRTQEFGIRIAIGASPANVLALVLRQGAWLGAAGVVIGAGGAALLARFLKELLFGVEIYDPAAFLGTAALLAAVVLAASYIPARRATKTDPIIALRAD